MCDLFGLCCNAKDRATLSLPIFAEYSQQMPHGWGIGYFDEERAIIKRGAERAKDSDAYFETIDKARSKVIISHIRYMTAGEMCERNCHPFHHTYFDKQWIFAHNGGVGQIINSLGIDPRSGGETDSEQVFLYLMDRTLDYTNGNGIRGIYPGLKNAIKNLFDEFGQNITLNFMLSNGNLQFIFSHYPGRRIHMLRRSKNYGGAVLTSTRKLTGENWEKIPKDSLLVIENGEVLVVSDPII